MKRRNALGFILAALTTVTPAVAFDADSNALRSLAALERPTIPHYFIITPEHARNAAGLELLTALARSTGAVAVNHTWPDGPEVVAKLRDQIPDLSVALWIDDRHFAGLDDYSDTIRHYEWLRDRRAAGPCADLAIFHWEKDGGDGLVAGAMVAAVREVYPSVEVTWYGHGEYSIGPTGSGYRDRGFEPERDLNCVTLYAESAPVMQEAIRQTRARDSRPIIGFLSWGYYHALTNPATGLVGWHFDAMARRSPHEWYLIGKLMRILADREMISAIWLYKGFDNSGFPLADRIEDWTYYLTGYHGRALEIKKQ